MRSLSFDQLKDGYEKTIVTAYRLLLAAMSLLGEFPEVALGLAELGQEEIGKSLSILAAFPLARDQSGRKWFWSGWKDHRLKAYRAYLYELIYPLRLLERKADGTASPIGGIRNKITDEKEWSFYVNFDEASQTFQSPEDSVKEKESTNRILTLLYLATTARSIGLALTELDTEAAYNTLGGIALRIC
jgi:AbiV family abortive infection protein